MVKIYGYVNNPSGLTSRLSAELVGIANHFKSNIELCFQDTKADLKSIMNIMALVIRYNDEFHIEIEGEDENEAKAKFEEALKELKLIK